LFQGFENRQFDEEYQINPMTKLKNQSPKENPLWKEQQLLTSLILSPEPMNFQLQKKDHGFLTVQPL